MRKLNADMIPTLAKVDPLRIVIDRRYVKPTEWDLAAVDEDLKDYVQLTRVIKATPVLQVVDNALVVVSGEPFIRAAREVTPPIEKVVCVVQGDEQLIRKLGLNIVTASQMLDEVPAHEVYEAFEMIRFARPLSASERKSFEAQITSFFRDMNEFYSASGNYAAISPFAWDAQNSRVHWSWRRNDVNDDANSRFWQILRRLKRDSNPLTSWNGLKPYF